MTRKDKPFCTGTCLFGKCPYPSCIKYAQAKHNARQIDADMQILTDTGLIPIECDKTVTALL
jgi:hypothetical protein